MISSIAVLALAASANAQLNPATYAPGLVQAFGALNLTTLITAATANAATFLPILIGDGSQKIVFAPTNAAFASATGNLTDPAYVTALIEYHLLATSFTPSAAPHTIVKTSMTAPAYVNLPGGAPQVVVLAGTTNATLTAVQALGNVVSIASAVYQNLQIYVIDTVLSIPQTLSATATAAGLTSLASALTAYAPGTLDALDVATGITVFAPNNAAFSAAMAAVGSLTNTQIANVLKNHVVTGGVVYSTGITNGQVVTTASGESLTLSTNSTGAYVTTGAITVKIITADVLIKNGVVHVIDGILANPNSRAVTPTNSTTPSASRSMGSPSSTAAGIAPSAPARTNGAAKAVVGSFAGVVAFAAALVL